MLGVFLGFLGGFCCCFWGVFLVGFLGFFGGGVWSGFSLFVCCLFVGWVLWVGFCGVFFILKHINRISFSECRDNYWSIYCNHMSDGITNNNVLNLSLNKTILIDVCLRKSWTFFFFSLLLFPFCLL